MSAAESGDRRAGRAGCSRSRASSPATRCRAACWARSGAKAAQVHAVEGVDFSVRAGRDARARRRVRVRQDDHRPDDDAAWSSRRRQDQLPRPGHLAALEPAAAAAPARDADHLQDPYESLDPRFRVRDTVEEPLLIHGIGASAAERDARSSTRSCRPGCSRPSSTSIGTRTSSPAASASGSRSPRAMVLQAEAAVADEPVSMLDVSVRAGILRCWTSCAARASRS